MTDPTAAAAERLRRRMNLSCYVMDKQSDTFDSFYVDVCHVARAYLAEHAADDAELITEEWLDETFGIRPDLWSDWRIGQFTVAYCYGWHLNRLHPLVNINDITTRGQLRLLLRALSQEPQP